MIEKKEFAKSVRMTATVKNYVDGFEGNGFNEKFENLVFFCLAHEKEIQGRIDSKREELDALKVEVNEMRSMYNLLSKVQTKISDIYLLLCNS